MTTFATRDAGHGGGSGLHQDLDRQGIERGDAGRLPGHARGDPRLRARTGRIVGFKAAGGVSTSKAALHRLVLVKETLGDEWLTPERIRIGASSLLNDLLMQYAKTETGRYGRAEDFSKE